MSTTKAVREIMIFYLVMVVRLTQTTIYKATIDMMKPLMPVGMMMTKKTNKIHLQKVPVKILLITMKSKISICNFF